MYMLRTCICHRGDISDKLIARQVKNSMRKCSSTEHATFLKRFPKKINYINSEVRFNDSAKLLLCLQAAVSSHKSNRQRRVLGKVEYKPYWGL